MVMVREGRGVACLLVAVLLLLGSAGAVLADDKVAVIDPQKVMLQHPKFEETQRQIKALVQKKQDEAKAAIDKETDNDKKAQIFEAARKDMALLEQKMMQPLFKDIDTAIRTVAKSKGYTVVMDSGAFFYGGEDITDQVVAELKKAK